MKHNIFRGWDDEKKIMFPAVDLSTPGRTWPEWFGRIDCELLQFTGRKDKNGVGLFEGDIFTSHYYPFESDGDKNYVGVIAYSDDPEFMSWTYELYVITDRVRGAACGGSLHDLSGIVLERIGSKQENPELLEMK